MFVIVASLFSCGDDDYSIAYTDNETKVALVGTLTLSRTEAAPTTNVGFTVTLPQTFEAEATVEVIAKSTYSSLEINPAQSRGYAVIPAGSTTGTGSFVMPGSTNDVTGEFIGIADYTTVSITGVALTQPEEGSVADPFTMTSEVQSITSNDYIPSWMLVRDQVLMVSLDWQGPYGSGENDFDLFIRDLDGTTYESSASGTRFEGDFFNNPANENHPDGDYFVNMEKWTTVDDTTLVPYRLTLTHPDGKVDLYTGMYDPTVANSNIARFTKTEDAEGNATYVTMQL